MPLVDLWCDGPRPTKAAPTDASSADREPGPMPVPWMPSPSSSMAERPRSSELSSGGLSFFKIGLIFALLFIFFSLGLASTVGVKPPSDAFLAGKTELDGVFADESASEVDKAAELGGSRCGSMPAGAEARLPAR